jgi:iron complex outermembrane receptor protein
MYGRYVFSAVALGLCSSAALAQAPGQSVEQQAGAIDEIVVTAQRREERLQDVPLSIAAYSGDTLRQLGASSVTDIVAHTPGVQFQAPAGSSGFPVYNIRGVTLLDFSYTNESSVALYADDVYLGNPAFATLQLFDVDRVEVLRGPQGTLYGRNASGGLVHYISRRPTDTLQGNALIEYGSFDDIVFEGAVSGPLSDRVRGRLAMRYNENDGWQKNRFTGTRLAKVDHAIGVRGIIEADLTDAVSLTVSANYSNTEGSEDGRASFGKRVPGSPTVSCSVADVLASRCANGAGYLDPDPDPRHVSSEMAKIPYDMEAAGGLVKLEADLGFGTLTSISAYQWGKKWDAIDVDAAPVSASNLEIRYFIRHKQFSEELRLGGSTDRFDWVVGAFYYEDSRFFTAEFAQLGLGNYTDQDIESLSGYGQTTYKLTDTVNLTAGLRYTNDKKELNELALVANPRPGTRDGTSLFLVEDKIDPSRTTWRLGIDWHVTPDVMLFATAATGFKSGGYNTSLVTALSAVGPVDPEKITTYEVGAKTQWFGGRLISNLNLYYSDYKDIQAAVSVPCTAPSCVSPSVGEYLNIGKAEIYGAELEFTARPLPDLSMSLGVAYNQNELSAPPTITIAGTPLDGKDLANTPKYSASGAINWEPVVNDYGSLILGADFSYQSKIFFRPDNTPFAVQKGYTLVGARVGWAMTNGIRIEAFARNLLDKEYFVSMTDVGEVAPATWGKPRTFGVRVSADF